MLARVAAGSGCAKLGNVEPPVAGDTRRASLIWDNGVAKRTLVPEEEPPPSECGVDRAPRGVALPGLLDAPPLWLLVTMEGDDRDMRPTPGDELF